MRMVGERLHDYDVQLCGYALGNVGQYRDDPKYARWLRQQAPAPVLEYWERKNDVDFDDEVLLDDNELYSLVDIFDGEPATHNREWLPYHALHKRYVATVKEVRDALTKQVAEGWSEDCRRFARRLESDQVRLADGLQTVQDWIGELRRLLRAMGASNFLPLPEGRSPTLSNSITAASPVASPDPRYAGLSPREVDDVERMREAIKAKGDHAKVKVLVKEAAINNKRGRKILRWLQQQEEYRGHGRTLPTRNPKRREPE